MSGYQWGAWAFAEVASLDIENEVVANGVVLTSDAIDLDGVAACEVGIVFTSPDSALVNPQQVRVFLFGEAVGAYQTIDDVPNRQLMIVRAVQNATRRGNAHIDPGQFGSVKLGIRNATGQSITVSLQYRTATFGTTPV